MNRVSNLITLDLVKKLREVKNASMKNYSYESAKMKLINQDTNKSLNQLMNDFLFIHKYGLDRWLKI
jgi:predicted transcriptional regulator